MPIPTCYRNNSEKHFEKMVTNENKFSRNERKERRKVIDILVIAIVVCVIRELMPDTVSATTEKSIEFIELI